MRGKRRKLRKRFSRLTMEVNNALDKCRCRPSQKRTEYKAEREMDQYREWVERMKEERREYLLRMGVEEEILRQVHHFKCL